MADIDDRWTRLDRATGERVRTARYGTGKRWAARWRDQADRQRSRSFDRKVDAERFLDQVRADLARGEYIDPAAGKVTLRKQASEWLASQTTDPASQEATERRIRTQILPILGDLELRALRPSTIQAWLAGLGKTHSPSTIRVTLSTLSTILTAAVADDLIRKNPCRSRAVRPPSGTERQVTPWSVDRVHAVANSLPDRFAAVVYAGAGCGLRQGEIWGLALDAVDFLGRTVHVTRQVKRVGGKPYFAPPKGGKERDVPLPESVGVLLSEHIRQHGTTKVTLPWLPTGKPVTVTLLFTEANGLVVNRDRFARVCWKSALAGVGVIPEREKGQRYPPAREHGLHVLRHTYASALLADGVDVRTLSEFMGHADATVTLRVYTHMLPSGADRARKAVDRVLGGIGGAPDVRQQDA